MNNKLSVIGAPSSAGAYAPGQERAPSALREAGLITDLKKAGVNVTDRGDVNGFRWKADSEHPRCMNVDVVQRVAMDVSDKVRAALEINDRFLVLGGDCTVELGTVAGVLGHTDRIGLIYIDGDTDLNTPQSTTDGALDWMGVAHLLNIEGASPQLTGLGGKAPMLQPDQILYFATHNVKPFERRQIEALGIREISLDEVAQNPRQAASRAAHKWGGQFDALLIHLDIDVLNFLDMPIAENTRRGIGLPFEQLMEALRVMLRTPNWTGLTVTEINPDHAEMAHLQQFSIELARAIGSGFQSRSKS